MSSCSVQRRFGALSGDFFAVLLVADLWRDGASGTLLGIDNIDYVSFGAKRTLVVIWRPWHCSSPLVPCVWGKYDTEPESLLDQPLIGIASNEGLHTDP